MATPSPAPHSDTVDPGVPLPADDPDLRGLDLRELRRHWAAAASRAPMTAAAMVGADRRAQALGVPGERLMEHAGTAVAAAARALAVDTGRWGRGPVVILVGPGNNGGDGLVAARRLAEAGSRVVVALVANGPRPTTPDAARNWDRIVRDERIAIVRTPTPRDLALLGRDIDKASVVVDALLGTGVQGRTDTNNCLALPGTNCIPDYPRIFTLGVFFGVEQRGRIGAVRILAGPTHYRIDGGGSALGGQARLELVSPSVHRIAVVGSARGGMVWHLDRQDFRMGAVGIGLGIY